MAELKTEKKSQAEKFREAAKEVKTDNDERRFDEMVKGIAKAPKKEKGDPKAAPQTN